MFIVALARFGGRGYNYIRRIYRNAEKRCNNSAHTDKKTEKSYYFASILAYMKKSKKIHSAIGRDLMSRKEVIKSNKVSELYRFTLGGYEQKVLIEGKSEDLPVVITLHGGPGTPIPFSVGARGLFPEFTEEMIMVYWDQLGCGSNNYVIDDRFTIQSFVEMTEDLICEVKKLFPQNPMYLFATSWGSILSAKILEHNPNIVDGVVVSGQIIKNVFFCDEVRTALETSKIPAKKLSQIKHANVDNYTSKDLQTISSCLQKYTDAYQNKKGEKAPMGKMIMGLMTSPDYSFADFKAMVINGYRQNNSIWKEILRLDLSGVLKEIKIPYIIFQGDTDIVASTKTVEETVSLANNPNLQCKIVENSGHLPGVKMMEAIHFALLNLKK